MFEIKAGPFRRTVPNSPYQVSMVVNVKPTLNMNSHGLSVELEKMITILPG